MRLEVNKLSDQNLKYKSFQLRIEFKEQFYNSDFENDLINKLDNAWKNIGVIFFWNIGESFADGFFDDFHKKNIELKTIIDTTKATLSQYENKISKLTFRDIN